MKFMIFILTVWIIFLQIKTIKLENKIKQLNGKIHKLIHQANNTVTNIIKETKPVPQPVQEKPIPDKVTEENDDWIEVIPNVENSHVNNITAKQVSKPKKNTGFEAMFMGNIFNKIGAVTILIGIGILVKLISSFIEFTDIMKISLGYFAGIGMFLGSLKLSRLPKMKNFSEVLMGTGFGALLITTYCATNVMQIFSVPVATVIASLIVIAIYIVADKQKTVSMLAIGLIGGYLNPFFINPDTNANFLFGYLIFLNILSLIFVYKNKDKQFVNIVNLIATALTVLSNYSATNHYTICHCLALWFIYLVYNVIAIKGNEKYSNIDKSQTILNLVILTLLSWILFKDNYNYIGILLFGTTILYSILGFLNNDKFEGKENSYYYSAIISLAFCTYFLTVEFTRVILWSIEAVLIAYTLKFGYKNMAKFSLGLLIATTCNVFLIKNIFQPDIYPLIGFNFVPPIFAGFIISYIFNKYNQTEMAKVFKFIAITLIYSYITILISSFFGNDKSLNYYKVMSYVIISFAYTANIILCTMSKNKDGVYNIIAYVIYLLGIIYLLVSEMYVPQNIVPILNLRLLAYCIAIADIYLFTKRNDNEFIKYLAVLLGYSYIHFESANIVNTYKFLNINWFITFMWTLYAGMISLFGIFQNKKFLKISGIWLSILVIIRLFIFDFAGLDMIFKLLAFLTLGIVLMLISYYYNKKTK